MLNVTTTNTQITWTTSNVVGHSIDPYTKKIDHTEGFGAFDSILSSYSLGVRTIDIGGGEHDYNAAYCINRFGIEQLVYDPFMRGPTHNKAVLKAARERPLDSCTSISVLNVIDSQTDRLKHINLCRSVVKECGKVFFKVWPGNGSGIPQIGEGNYQSNKHLKSYFNEIVAVFGLDNVKLDLRNQIIIATKLNP